MTEPRSVSSNGDGEARPWRIHLLWTLALVSALASILLLGELGNLDRQLEKGSPSNGIADLELAFTAKQAEGILKGWPVDSPSREHSLRKVAVRSVYLDFGLIVAYWLLFSSLYRLVLLTIREAATKAEHAISTKTWRLWVALGLFATLAALLDVGENFLLLRILGVGTSAVPGGLVATVGILALLKFLLLAIAALPLIVIAIVRGRRFLQKRLPGTVDPSHFANRGQVLRRESEYLAERRSKVPGLDPTYKEAAQPIGMALSGGGIRSATLNLGSLEALVRLGILPKVDYLATVSGGGYIGSLLSSLLSINSRRYEESPTGTNEQYRFEKEDKAQFTTEGEKTPFHQELIDHLRTHGDFLIRRLRLIHRDVLRVVATLLGGIFYHLLISLIILTVLAGLYLGVVQWMAGPLQGMVADAVTVVQEGSDEEISKSLDESKANSGESETIFARYVENVFGSLRNKEERYPFWVSLLVGFIVLPTSMLCISWLVWGSSFPDRWFERGSESVEENREYQSLWALFYITLLVAVLVTVVFVRSKGAQPSYLLLPMSVYVGGWLSSLVLHALVAVAPLFGRNARSRFGAWKGIFNYLTMVSVLAVFFPLGILWVTNQPEFTLRTGGLVWLFSFLATWLFSRNKPNNPVADQAKELAKKLAAFSLAVRNFLLGVAVAIVIGGGLLFLSALILQASLYWDKFGQVEFAFETAGAAAILLALLGFLLDFNKLSLHYFYRDRLVETYLQTLGPGSGESLRLHRDNAEMRLEDLHGSREGSGVRRRFQAFQEYVERVFWAKTSGDDNTYTRPRCVTSAPYHLVITCLNLTKSRDLKRRNRKSDHFIFSKLYCGSESTGYMDTRQYRSGETKLARAMTISGAAVSPAIGSRTFFAQAFATALFNIRLGQWMENPSYRGGVKAHSHENGIFWPIYLLKEMQASTDADSRLVYLTDGGHTGDNVGIVPLLQRRCRLILAFDAECDPELRFGSLNEAMRQFSIDENIKVDMDLTPIYSAGPFESDRHVAVGRIDYGTEGRGWLLVFKSSLTGDEPEAVKNYARTHPAFPNQTTGDLFFDDAQFEAYRALASHQVEEGFGRELGEALDARGWREDWLQDLGELSS